jgi:hypothetical protein
MSTTLTTEQPIRTFQAAADRRDARPERIRRVLLVAAIAAGIQPMWQLADYVAHKTAATVELAKLCRGMPECNPFKKIAYHE